MPQPTDVPDHITAAISKVFDDVNTTVAANKADVQSAAASITAPGWNLAWVDAVGRIALRNADLVLDSISTSMTALRQMDEE